MILLVFVKPDDTIGRACVSGLSALGHRPRLRNAQHVKDCEVETCDMVVCDAGWHAQKVISAYGKAGIPVIVVGDPILPMDGYKSITLDSWEGIPPVECPNDRAVSIGAAPRFGFDGNVLTFDGAQIAECGEECDAESVGSRLAYAVWSLKEIESGAPFAFIFDVISGKEIVPTEPEIVEPEPACEAVEAAKTEANTELKEISVPNEQKRRGRPPGRKSK